MRDHPVRKDYAILRSQSDGKINPLTLRELRARVEQDPNQPNLFILDTQAACVVCGLGDLSLED